MGERIISIEDYCPALSNELTVVLLGSTGSGVSATGNTILKSSAFASKRSLSSVTRTSEMEQSVVDGRVVKAIDTPGLINFSLGADFVINEIVNCIKLAKDGIHAIVVVLSLNSPFRKEEATAIQSLKILFGANITNYVIIVFTHEDELDDDETLDDILAGECNQPLKVVLGSYENRILAFDNKTKDKEKRDYQVKQFYSLVDKVLAENDGKSYKNELFIKLHEQTDKAYQDRVKEIKKEEQLPDLPSFRNLKRCHYQALKLLL
ncbi:PREDICTED: immune-associated nucleotide-binding protein 8-like isoform X2 [Nelumbo nucifera]|uniref:Immune-associated nucleotide-binding protein 8-like isoform X2 n=1 Tax=Nelumbo nucifera TaxID=4432 RepID=A0A1U7Z2Q7_NELNU|nr:PREDICTED: immune-associated nucleotide-binding protein 8-like isoform X2 [Nelumbo nucifera]